MLKQQRAAAAGSVIILGEYLFISYLRVFGWCKRLVLSLLFAVSQGTVSTPDLEVSLDLLRKEEVTLAAIEYPSLGESN